MAFHIVDKETPAANLSRFTGDQEKGKVFSPLGLEVLKQDNMNNSYSYQLVQ